MVKQSYSLEMLNVKDELLVWLPSSTEEQLHSSPVQGR